MGVFEFIGDVRLAPGVMFKSAVDVPSSEACGIFGTLGLVKASISEAAASS
ncbi:MAG: hypothetical protein ACX93T_03925 [Bacteroidota bacterium]